MKFRPVENSEYKTLASLHSLAFDDFFLTSLGNKFLRTYYKSVLKSNESITSCAVNEEGKMTGFSIGCTHAKGFHKRLVIKFYILFIIQAFWIVFTRPRAIFRLIKNMDKKANDQDDGNYAELLSIAVDPEYKNMGIGKELIKVFEQEAFKKGCTRMALTTDYENNDKVISFYKKVGYDILSEFTTYPNRRMYKLIKTLP